MFGLLHDNGCIGRYVQGTLLATITDPFESLNEVNAPNDGYINANLSPIVYQGMLYTTLARL
jgi:hypothetical protein